MSAFYKNINFTCLKSDIVFEDTLDLNWNGIHFHFFVTQGHSLGSVCILFNNNLITGDTIILNERELKLSFLKISEKVSFPINIFSGHGEDFTINNKTEFF